MATRSPAKNPQMKKAVSLRELNESEVRGVLNDGYNEIKLGPSDSNDPKLGVFMVSNQDFVNGRQEFDYMEELGAAPWYHGCISRARAEDLLDESVPEGTFIVRSGIKDGEFFISVKAPEGDRCHIEVEHCSDGFVAVCGPNAEPTEFDTFEKLLDFLKTNPTQFEGQNDQIVLKKFLDKSNHQILD